MMRFPWLQVDADFVAAHAGDLASHLGIGRREAIGLAVDLWTWALARAPDDVPPVGIVTGTGAVPDRLLAGSVGWTGPAEQFTAALIAVGLAVRIDDGYRLTGFGRYRATWEKNRRRAGGKPERNRTGTGAEPTRKTQTQTQIEDVPPPAADAGASEPTKRPALRLTPTPAQKERKPSKQELLAQQIAEQRTALLGPDALPDETFGVGRLNQMLAPLLAVEDGLLARAHALFCADPWVRNEAAPPAPLRLFAAQWSKWVGIAMKQGVPA